jgi:hypothetical protein
VEGEHVEEIDQGCTIERDIETDVEEIPSHLGLFIVLSKAAIELLVIVEGGK